MGRSVRLRHSCNTLARASIRRRQEGPHTHCAVISPDNRFVYAADLGLDKVLSYRLEPDAATLTPSPQPFVRTLPGAGPRHLTFHPDGRHMYVINELANSITLFDCDVETGMLDRTADDIHTARRIFRHDAIVPT